MNRPEAMADTIARGDREWRDLIEPILALGESVTAMWPEVNGNPQLHMELLKFLYSEIGAGFMTVAYANDHHPDFFPCWSQVFNNGGNINPDGVYYLSPLDDQGVYKLSGFRGSLKIVDLQLGDGSVFAHGRLNKEKSFGPTLANYDLDQDVTVGEDGWFEVLLSPTRPTDYSGDWWPLPPKTNYILVRQFAYDWVNEVDARIGIDRLDTPAAKPRPSADEVKADLARVPEFMYSSLHTLDVPVHANPGLSSPELHNQLTRINYAPDQAGRAAQWYVAGRFELDDDEALLIELNPGQCRYWNLHVCNELSNTLDFMNRLVCTNGFQAEAEGNGSYHIVMSARDPGVPNWLDTVGHNKGFLWGRMDSCENDIPPKTTKINLSDLDKHIPPGTRRVTPAEREAEIRRRRLGAQLRRRW